MNAPEIQERLDYLRGEIDAERISMGEIAELQGLAEHIDPSDVVLLQWAGVPEHLDGTDPHVPGTDYYDGRDGSIEAETDDPWADDAARSAADRDAFGASTADWLPITESEARLLDGNR